MVEGGGVGKMEKTSPGPKGDTPDSTPQRSQRRGRICCFCLPPWGPSQQWSGGWGVGGGQLLGGRIKGPAGATGTNQSNLGSEK